MADGWLSWIVLVLLFVVMALLLRRIARPITREREAEILRRKYGDLPMFEDFFRRLEVEERKENGSP